jgi:hypothetical protein
MGPCFTMDDFTSGEWYIGGTLDPKSPIPQCCDFFVETSYVIKLKEFNVQHSNVSIHLQDLLHSYDGHCYQDGQEVNDSISQSADGCGCTRYCGCVGNTTAVPGKYSRTLSDCRQGPCFINENCPDICAPQSTDSVPGPNIPSDYVIVAIVLSITIGSILLVILIFYIYKSRRSKRVLVAFVRQYAQ